MTAEVEAEVIASVITGTESRGAATLSQGKVVEPKPSAGGACPPYGSIYRHLGEAAQNPGPGHYADAHSQPELIGMDPSKAHTWGHCGQQPEALVPTNLEMFNAGNQHVGPGRYDVR